MDSFCSEVGSRDAALLINEFSVKKKVAGELTGEGKDAFWNDTVPCGCRLASAITDSGAGAPMIVFQTFKNPTKRMNGSTTYVTKLKKTKELRCKRNKRDGGRASLKSSSCQPDYFISP